MPRRLITIPTLLLIWMLMVASTPIWLVAGLVLGVIRRRRFIALRLLAFVLVFTTMEVLGLSAMLGAFLVGRASNQRFHHRLQAWWAGCLFAAVRFVLKLEVEVTGDEVLAQGPYLLLMRHSSLADTLLPAALVSRKHGTQLRYVLKKELRFDPCLDLCGSRLPNHFIDRSSPNENELLAIARLAENLGPKDGVLIYPEGTRFSERRRQKRLADLEDRGAALLEQARALKATLAPKIRGVAALRSAAPAADVVICAHHGFEGFRTLGDVLSGDMVGRTVSVRFWRIAADAVPASQGDELLPWLYREWAEVDRFVVEHAA
ncbi:MAG: 1-acyl-sn-glycerol-3-phosphate acyltransferase [Myxococcota bacterium]